MKDLQSSTKYPKHKLSKPLRKVFDYFSARASLPLVKAILSDIMAQAEDYNQIKRSQAETPATKSLSNEDTATFLELRKKLEVSERMRELGEELKRLGVCLLDLSRGIVGFPSVINGKLAYLLYRHKEDAIKYWRFADESLTHLVPVEWSSKK
jgi:hypothetical protein